jgi:hypothetical protein
MDTKMVPSRTQSPSRRALRPACALLAVGTVLALAGPASTEVSAASSGLTATTPTVAAPAAANPQPATGGGAAAPTGGSTTATTTATPPATTTPTSVPPAASTQTTTSPAAATTGTTQPRGSAAVVVHTQTHSTSKLSATAIAAAVLAALIALACLVWGLARMLAYEPRWTLSLRHVMAEAGFRASATWAELTDWARLGR